jgi:hypothetical protein
MTNQMEIDLVDSVVAMSADDRARALVRVTIAYAEALDALSGVSPMAYAQHVLCHPMGAIARAMERHKPEPAEAVTEVGADEDAIDVMVSE